MRELDIGFDNLLYSFSKGMTIDMVKKGYVHTELEKVKEWKNRNGYEFHIYGNEHLIENKPHFHLLKKSENFEAKFYFNGEIIDLKRGKNLPPSIHKGLCFFLEDIGIQEVLIESWNLKNPNFIVSKNIF